MCCKMSKISNLSLLDEFFQAPINQSIYLSIYQSIRDCLYSRATYFKVNCLYKECTKTRFWLGLGTYDAPPGSQVGWGGGHSLTIPFPHYAFRVSVLWPLKTKFLATPMPRLRVGLSLLSSATEKLPKTLRSRRGKKPVHFH